MEIRPRTTGEILDDAWRLTLADALPLLLFSVLFLIPAFTVLLLLVAEPVPAGIAQCGLPALAAVLLPLTGLASGACQELFRRRAADESASVRDCLAATLRHGLEHAAARAVLMVGVVLGLFLLLIPGLTLWSSCTSLHVLLAAGKGRSGTLFRELRRDAASAAIKSAAITFCRLPLLFLVAVELHMLGLALLWIADNLGGFDTALLSVELTFGANSVYTMALFLLSWLLLTPFFEAGNFLLHTDIRTRQEGLDLQYRVQRAFANSPSSRQPAVGRRTLLSCLLLTAYCLLPTAARADEEQLDVVRSVRQGIETIRDEVKKAEPYPGGQRWTGRLHGMEVQLVNSVDGERQRFRWFDRAIADFGDRKREDALHVLDDLHRRLSLLEDSLAPRQEPAKESEDGQTRRSPEDVKSLLRGTEARKRDRAHPRERIKEEGKEPKREEIKRDDPEAEDHQNGPRIRGGGGPSVSAPGGGGLSILGWVLLAGLGLAVLIVALVLFLMRPRGPRVPKATTTTGAEPTADSETRQVLEESPTELWRQAEGLAGEGRFRDAVRILYLAVLSLLHRRQFIRFEPTRTNGEYVRQIRLSEQAPIELHDPFHGLTDLFEAKWYGERACESGDYRACRTLAEEIQRLSAIR
ncbi:MAG TPA: DUF4129 domain-containing protein [Gemmataceae bacterium]|nr:DUF4129 domain-containing protein [Gemmataceae bacterium]